MKQYLGGHDETWGGVRINIDSNFIDLGKGTTARPEPKPCNGTRINFPDYELLRPPRTKKNGTVVKPDTRLVSAAQCLLKQQGYFDGEITGSYGGRMSKATRAWQADHGYAEKDLWSRQHWMTLLATGPKTTLKRGASGVAVRRLQRALNATSVNRKVAISGVFGEGLEPAVKSWQSSIGHDASGVVNARTWRAVLAGKRS